MKNVLLKELTAEHQSLVTVQHTYKASPDFTLFFPHWHDTVEIINIIEGEINIILNNQSHTLSSEQICFISPLTIHSGISGKNGCKYMVLQFSTENIFNDLNLENSITNNLKESIMNIQPIISGSKANALFKKCYENCIERSIHGFLMNRSSTCELLAHLLEFYKIKETALYSAENKFNKILQYISEHYTESISTKELAEQFYCSESHFCRMFRSKTGIPFSKYINILRIENSQRLLLNDPNISKSQISYLCGFNTQNYFNKVFKDITGYSPNEWIKFANESFKIDQ